MTAGDREPPPPPKDDAPAAPTGGDLSQPLPKRTLSQDVFGATLWNTLLLPLRVAVSLFTSVVYYQILPRAEVGVILLLQNLANTVGIYIDLGIERTMPRFLPEIEETRGRGGVRRLLARALGAKALILLPVVAALLLLATPLARSLAERQRDAAQAAEARAEEVTGHARQDVLAKAAADRARHRRSPALGRERSRAALRRG